MMYVMYESGDTKIIHKLADDMLTVLKIYAINVNHEYEEFLYDDQIPKTFWENPTEDCINLLRETSEYNILTEDEVFLELL